MTGMPFKPVLVALAWFSDNECYHGISRAIKRLKSSYSRFWQARPRLIKRRHDPVGTNFVSQSAFAPPGNYAEKKGSGETRTGTGRDPAMKNAD